MINYIRMKRAEWKIKATLYNAIAAFIDNQKEILELLQKIYIAFKDVSAEDLQKKNLLVNSQRLSTMIIKAIQNKMSLSSGLEEYK